MLLSRCKLHLYIFSILHRDKRIRARQFACFFCKGREHCCLRLQILYSNTYHYFQRTGQALTPLPSKTEPETNTAALCCKEAVPHLIFSNTEPCIHPHLVSIHRLYILFQVAFTSMVHLYTILASSAEGANVHHIAFLRLENVKCRQANHPSQLHFTSYSLIRMYKCNRRIH